MAATLQKVSELPRKRKGTLKRIARALRFPVDESLPKSRLQIMKLLLNKDR